MGESNFNRFQKSRGETYIKSYYNVSLETQTFDQRSVHVTTISTITQHLYNDTIL